MKSLTNLRKGLALVLCAAMLFGDTTMLRAAQVESTTVGAIVSESKAETEVAEDVPTEEVEQEQEEAEVVEPQAEATEVSEAEEKSEAETEETTQVEAEDVETALENKALEATYTATVGETTVTVVAPEGAFTEEVTLQVTEVEITDEMQAQLDEQAIAEQKAINSASAYDISFVNAEGKEVEPAKEVQVSIATAEVNSGDDASVYHFDEEKAAVADMEATVVESGDVAFETNHFSTYVIVNRGKDKVKVKIHHMAVVKENHDPEAIYADDNRELSVGSRILDYAKATNWKVAGIFVKDDSKAQPQWIWEKDINELRITKDTEIWVHYDPKEEPVQGEVTVWDYDVQPPNQDAVRTYKYNAYSSDRRRNKDFLWTYYSSNGNESTYTYKVKGLFGGEHDRTAYLTLTDTIIKNNQAEVDDVIRNDSKFGYKASYYAGYYQIQSKDLSINYSANYTSQPGYDANRASLTMGKTDQNLPENQHDDEFTYNNHTKQKINDYGEGNNAIKYGIVNGVDENNNVVFNVNQPGVFSTAESVGKHVYNNDEFSLSFNRKGDTYTLDHVKTYGGHQVKAGADFFIVQDAPSVTDGANTGTQNDYFGMRYDVKFSIGDYVGPLDYEFTGDDDLWVVLDGEKVVIDLGGIHGEQSQKVDLWDYIDGGRTGCDRTKEHKLTILYLERGAVASNCQMVFTIPNAQIVDYTTPVASIDITKVDLDDATPLEGATFKLHSSNGVIDRTVSSDAEGKLHFGDLLEDEYTLTEIAPPEGYDVQETTWTVRVTVNEDGKTATAKLYDADGNEVTDNVITNKKHEEEPVVPTFDLDKTVKVTDYDNREYEITLTANSTTQASTTVTTGGPVDVMLLLDTSGSMNYDDVVTSLKYVGKGKYEDVSNWLGGLSGTYYVKSGNEYCEVYNDAWIGYSYKYKTSDGKSHSLSDSTYLYKKEVTTEKRIDALKESTTALLKSISKKSPNSKVGIVGFSSYDDDDEGLHPIRELKTIGKNPDEAIKSLDNITVYGGTSPELALTEASRQFSAVANDGRKKIVILFTDGKPTGNGTSWSNTEATKAENAATALKNAGATIYTVGFALASGSDEEKWLKNKIASNSGYAFTTETQAGLSEIFEIISQTITQNQDISGATVTDVIDARFELVETPAGAKVTNNADGTTTLVWEDETLPYDKSKQLTKKIKIRAKADFLGGNKVPTNITPDSGISIGEEGEITPFPQPTVNVKLLNLTGAADEETVFLGDSIDASNLDKILAKAIKANGTALLQNPTFNADGKITVDYVYPGTTDKVGTITFTKKAEGEGAAFTKHDAEYIGSPAELYTVTAEYKPLAPSERPKDLTATAADGGAVVTTSATATATHKVNVVAGMVTIQKTIAKKDYKKELGDPIFTFELTNTTTGKVYYKTLRFKEVKEGLFNETLEATIEGLPKGTYTVEELDTMGFTFKSLNVDGYNKKEEGKVGTFTLELNHDKATATYANMLTHSPRDTDTDVVKNSFKLNGKTSSTKDADNGNTADVGKHTTLKITNEGGNQ